MGNSYAARRSLWWYGTSDVSSTTYQDDMAVIARPANGFGYRPEPGDGTAATATPLLVNQGTQLSGAGLIIRPTDLDYFAFASGPGAVSFTVSVPADVNNLAPRIELLDATGSTVIASAGPSAADFSATLTAMLPAAGAYRILVASSDGRPGNVGHYSISGTIGSPAGPGGGTGTGTVALNPPPAATPPAAVTRLVVVSRAPRRIILAWTPSSFGAQDYTVERSTNGKSWGVVGRVAAGSSGFTDGSVARG